MTQIEQIKAELQKRLVKYDPDYTDAGQELQEVLAFIDSLPAESPDFEAEWQRYTASRKDDLRTNAVTMNVKEVAKHFAEWQKKQDESNKEEIYRIGVQDGMRYFKEQMMKEVVESRYMKTIDGECYVESSVFSPDGFVQMGGKVKLIILKEDE